MSKPLKTYVAMLDILGFKEYINTAPNDEIYNTFNELTKIVEEQLDVSIKLGEGAKIIQNELESEQHLNYLIISDTIILWTDKPNIVSLNKLLKAVQNIIYRAIGIKILLRGSIVFDDIFVFYNKRKTKTINVDASIVGTAIINAYKQSELQDWVGCTISDNVIINHEKRISLYKKQLKSKGIDIRTKSAFINRYKNYYIPYDDIPMKNGIETGFVIQWINFPDAPTIISKSQIEISFNHYKKYNGQSAVKIKLLNTLEFVSHVHKSLYKSESLAKLSKLLEKI